MEGEREKSRDQNEGSGQQPPIGQQGQQQPTGEGGQKPLGQQGDFATQEPGQANPSEAATLSEGTEPDLGGEDVGPGGYSPESGGSDLGGGETGLGDSGGGGFVGTQSEDPGEYLQRSGNPEAGFAEQGRGAPDQGDIERGGERSQNRDSDIEGSSENR